ncbi:MAG: RES family NAD+ phosphorylase [Thermoanaerobaculia bacterium]
MEVNDVGAGQKPDPSPPPPVEGGAPPGAEAAGGDRGTGGGTGPVSGSPQQGRDEFTQDPTFAVVGGRSGAAGRNLFVETQTQRAYQMGLATPPTGYNSDVFRAVPTSRYPTYADFTWSSPGRYNAPGQSTIYASESYRGVAVEANNYSGLAGQSVVKSQFTGPVVDATRVPGLTAGALTEPYGSKGSHETLLTRVTGEDPYALPRAFGNGARDQGAAGVRVPANGGAVTHLNVFPENARNLPSDLMYVGHQNVNTAGNPGGMLYDPRVKLPPDGSTPNRNLGNPTAAATDAEAHGRAGSVRYGMAGAAGLSIVQSLANDGRITGDELVSAGVNTTLGGITAHANDVLAPRLGTFRAGALVDGVVSAGTSLWQNGNRFERGEITAGQATADVVVDTGVGISAGLTGMAAGAAVGSVVPVVGTAAGAVIGFTAGVIASSLTASAIEGSGLGGWAREGLGNFLDNNFSRPLGDAWSTISGAQNHVERAASDAWSAVSSTASNVAGNVGGWVRGLFGQ